MQRLAHAEELARKRLQKKEQQTLDVMFWGLWQSEMQVDEHLSTFTTKTDKTKSLKAQLNFRHNVLHQQPQNKKDNLFAFSKNKIPLTTEELATNLKKLICESMGNQGSEPGSSSSDPLLVGKRIRHLCKTDDQEEWWLGKVISQVRIEFMQKA